jgi:CubicO group peptidase (beta-lactamase class C family)
MGFACLALAALTASAQEPDGNPRQVRGRAIEGMVAGAGEESLQQFIDLHLATEYSDCFAPGALLEHLRAIRAECKGFGGVLFEPTMDGGTRIIFLQESRQASLVFRLQPDPPGRIVALDLEPGRRAPDRTPDVPPIAWETLSQRLEEEARAGFSGTVLMVRDGTIVLHRGYGLANRELGIPNTTETIYAIGSVPIDFTRAAILKLAEMGKLRTSDSIARFLDPVPDDKRSMTLDHLLSGRSGLPDFFHVVGVDADPDLSWIDRSTAIRRILGQDLLFPPGQGRAHSHAAWVLLAAIVEIASNQSYGEFLERHFFGPAGMTRTGLHEDGERFADDRFAVGYGARSVGKLNIPKYWGRTSWLVMGSGGMQSTTHDLHRWLLAIREGATLSPASAASYWSGGVAAGGDERGFLCMYTEGPENLVILCSNAHSGPNDRTRAFATRLTELVAGRPPSPFVLGVELRVEAGGEVSVARVMPGGAAERDGLRAGDVLVSANGTPMRDPIGPILESLLRTGTAITFEIDRDGARSRITVRPDPRTKPPS